MMHTATQIKTLEEVKDLLYRELGAQDLDAVISFTRQGTDEVRRPEDTPINRVYTQINSQIMSLKIRERVK